METKIEKELANLLDELEYQEGERAKLFEAWERDSESNGDMLEACREARTKVEKARRAIERLFKTRERE